MEMAEYVRQISFLLGFPSNKNIENVSIEDGVEIAFTEMKRYFNTPVDLTVPYARRIDVDKLGIKPLKVVGVKAAYPRVGLSLGAIDSGNVFTIAASANAYAGLNSVGILNIEPIMTELGYAQLRNTLTTDLQWQYDPHNKVIYVTHRDPIPAVITISYVPDYEDVSEVINQTYINYIIRLGLAFVKIALGRSRSKYQIEGSNVTLDGDALLSEGNAELEAIRSELSTKTSRLVAIN
jgi:hypothetical protein